MDWQCDSTTCSYEVSPDFAHSGWPFREVVAPADFTFVYASPWRIAVPVNMASCACGCPAGAACGGTYGGGTCAGPCRRADAPLAWPAVAALLARMRAEGPAAAGYTPVGSTLVPLSLTPGGRMALATATANYVRI